jgi:hypothetical protein
MKRSISLLFIITILSSCTTVKNDKHELLQNAALQNAPVIMTIIENPVLMIEDKEYIRPLTYKIDIYDPLRVLIGTNKIKSITICDNLGDTYDISTDNYCATIRCLYPIVTNTLSTNYNAISLEEYKIIIKTFDDHILTRSFEPGNILSKQCPKVIYSNSYNGQITQNSIYTLKTPIILSVNKGKDTIDISFTINDPRVKNADLVFLDDQGYFIGYYENIYDPSKQQPNYINDGKGLFNNNEINKVELHDYNIQFLKKSSFSQIKQIAISVYNNYAPHTESETNDLVILKTFSEAYKIE